MRQERAYTVHIMCGIVGYAGKKQAYSVLIDGLRYLEYRGYDSSGVALLSDGIKTYKRLGKIAELEKFVEGKDVHAEVGIGHTRWATHGVPSDVNAHPHVNESGDIALVHNGIIENHVELRSVLEKKGHIFVSQTDTEVAVHLIEDIMQHGTPSLLEAVREAARRIVGTYAFAVVSKKEPGVIVVARKGSPLVIGIGEGELFVASDPYPLTKYTKKVVYLEDGEVALVSADGKLDIRSVTNESKSPHVTTLDIEIKALEKQGFDHFMQKEIYEQPSAIRDSIRGRLYSAKDDILNLGGLRAKEEELLSAKRYIFIACGTSWHASLVAKKMFEDLLHVPADVAYASEFRYGDPIVGKDDVVFAISQSGETADTLAAVHLAKERGATIVGICNVVGSAIARTSHVGLYTHAGPEIGVASTKAFTTQISVLLLVALYIAQKKKSIAPLKLHEIISAFADLPEVMERTLAIDASVKEVAERYKDVRDFLYLGRGFGFPIALEGALKMKELSYIHAEGYPAAEMKHGPIAMIDEHMPIVMLAPEGSLREKLHSTAEEIKARKGKIIAIVTEGETSFDSIADDVIRIPAVHEMLQPFVMVVPLQMLAYYVALKRGCDVDKPRNLAKSVTVE